MFTNTENILAVQAFNASKKIITTFDLSKDKERFEIYCRFNKFLYITPFPIADDNSVI